MKVFENQLTDVPRKTYHPRKSERKFYAENQYPKFQYIMTLSLEPDRLFMYPCLNAIRLWSIEIPFLCFHAIHGKTKTLKCVDSIPPLSLLEN